MEQWEHGVEAVEETCQANIIQHSEQRAWMARLALNQQQRGFLRRQRVAAAPVKDLAGHGGAPVRGGAVGAFSGVSQEHLLETGVARLLVDPLDAPRRE